MFRLSVISPQATTLLASSVASVEEGQQVTITLTTTGVQNGQPLPYTISGTNITSSDFVGLSSLSGTIAPMWGTATLILTLTDDAIAEGTETFRVSMVDWPATYVDVNITDAAPAGIAWDGGASVWDGGASNWAS